MHNPKIRKVYFNPLLFSRNRIRARCKLNFEHARTAKPLRLPSDAELALAALNSVGIHAAISAATLGPHPNR